jgi:hypothetical protein
MDFKISKCPKCSINKHKLWLKNTGKRFQGHRILNMSYPNQVTMPRKGDTSLNVKIEIKLKILAYLKKKLLTSNYMENIFLSLSQAIF